MNRRRLCAGALVAFGLSCAASSVPAASLTVLPAQSEVVFVARQMGVPVEGRFRRFDLQLTFDPAQPTAAVARLVVDTASISLGAAEFDRELLKPEWLSAVRHPQATFVSTRFRSVSPDRYEVVGTLALKGRSRHVVLPITLTRSSDGTTAGGAIVIRRREFGLGEGEWSDTTLVADEVEIRFRFALRGLPAR